MRITKRIEEYIRQQVREKAHNNARITSLKNAAEEECQRYLQAFDNIKTRAAEEFEKVLQDIGHPTPEHYKLSISRPWGVDADLPATKEYSQAKRDMDKQIETTIQDILVTMEMGGDKEQLTTMLNNVNFE